MWKLFHHVSPKEDVMSVLNFIGKVAGKATSKETKDALIKASNTTKSFVGKTNHVVAKNSKIAANFIKEQSVKAASEIKKGYLEGKNNLPKESDDCESSILDGVTPELAKAFILATISSSGKPTPKSIQKARDIYKSANILTDQQMDLILSVKP